MTIIEKACSIGFDLILYFLGRIDYVHLISIFLLPFSNHYRLGLTADRQLNIGVDSATLVEGYLFFHFLICVIFSSQNPW